MLATYENWPLLESLDDLQEAEMQCEAIARYAPFYTIVKGHVAHAERSAARAVAATEHASQQAATAAQAVGDFEGGRSEAKELREALAEAQQKRAAAEAEASELREEYRKIRQGSKKKMVAFDSVKEELEICKDDLKHHHKDFNAQRLKMEELTRQIDGLRKEISKHENDGEELRRQIFSHRAEAEEIPRMRQELASFKSGERYHEVRFADRVSRDVFDVGIATLCGGGSHSASAKAASVVLDPGCVPLPPSHFAGSPLHARSLNDARGTIFEEAGKSLRPEVVQRMLDHLCTRLRALPKKVQGLEGDVEKLQSRFAECRKLVPVWNADAIEDLDDAYDEQAPVHRQTYSESDPRCFAALGFGPDVPLYMQAKGLVRHVFVSKAELEEFIDGFLKSLFAPPAAEKSHAGHGGRRHSVADASAAASVELNTEQMHVELYHFMRRHVEKETKDLGAAPQALAEFAYALMAGVEANRHDPDMELFDLMLCGALHPTVTEDAWEMLKSLERLLKDCQEGLVAEEANQVGRRGGGGSSRALNVNATRDRGLVTKRTIRATLETVFPEKSPARHNAIVRALHATMQSLDAGARTPSADCVYVTDLFAQTQDGAQTPFVEEVRRQHYYEILDFARAIRDRLGDDVVCREGLVSEHQLSHALQALEVHTATNSIEDFVRLAFEPPPSAVRRGAVTPPSVDSRPTSARGRGQSSSRRTASRPSSADVAASSSPVSAAAETVPSAGKLLRRLRRRALLRPRKLWVRAEPGDVVRKILQSAHGCSEFDGFVGGKRNVRSRAIMVAANPVAKMEDDEVMGWADDATPLDAAPKPGGRIRPHALDAIP